VASSCGVCRHEHRAEIDAAILRGDLRLRIARRHALSQGQVEAHATKHLPTIWERCQVCARQMFGGSRCLEHNPTPELRQAMTR
jgi:hypothetical protein